MKKFPVLLLILAAAVAALAAAGGSYGIGLAFLPAVAAAVLAVLAVAAQLLSRFAPRFYNIAARCCVFLICAAAAVCLVASAQILSRYFDEPAPENAAVIVLGCGLSRVDRTSPSLMLYGRLNAAAEYLRENPDAHMILSGGQGGNEDISEAEAMYRYFEARGFDMSRIYKEERSSSTSENLAFSLELANELGIDLSGGVVIVTDGFHQFRAHSLTRAPWLVTYTKSAHAPLALQAFYWAREIPGIVAQVWLKGL